MCLTFISCGKIMTPDNSSDSSSCDEGSNRPGFNYETKKSKAIIIRPNASSGFWLCTLLPLALSVSYFKFQKRTTTESTEAKCHSFTSTNADQMLAIAAVGMCIESLCFFMYLFVETGILLKLLISFAPGLLTTFLYSWLMSKSLGFAFFWGFTVTFCYQNAYIHLMRGLPKCFTFGEASILVQGCTLFVMNCLLQLPQLYMGHVDLKGDELAQITAIMMSALLCVLVTCGLLAAFKTLRVGYGFYPLMAVLLVAVTMMPVTSPLPIVFIFQFILSDLCRICIILFYLLLVAATIAAISWQLKRSTQPKASTSMRKVFHVLIFLVYVPGLIYQCSLLYLSSGVALAIFTVLELIRVLEIPPLGGVLKNSFKSFSDEKDAGLLALTPFCLLIGISMPLWLSPCACSNVQNTAAGSNLLSLMAGILSIGVGDTAASIIGSKYGHLKWKNSCRTLEGTSAYVVAVCLAVYALYVGGFTPMSNVKWFITAAAIFVSSLVEAHTNQIDNLVLPLIFYIIVSLA